MGQLQHGKYNLTAGENQRKTWVEGIRIKHMVCEDSCFESLKMSDCESGDLTLINTKTLRIFCVFKECKGFCCSTSFNSASSCPFSASHPPFTSQGKYKGRNSSGSIFSTEVSLLPPTASTYLSTCPRRLFDR